MCNSSDRVKEGLLPVMMHSSTDCESIQDFSEFALVALSVAMNENPKSGKTLRYGGVSDIHRKRSITKSPNLSPT